MTLHEVVEVLVQHATNTFEKNVVGMMAFLAYVVAVVSVLGQHFNTEKLLNQQLGSDQWAYYQVKDIRRYTAQATGDLLTALKANPAVISRYTQDANRYKQQSAEIQDKAREFERERDRAGQRADHFHLGEILLEIAIVFCSLAILSKRQPLFVGGVALAVIGGVIAVAAYWV